MAVGKTLTIYLAADLKKFNQGLSDGEKKLTGFSSNLNKLTTPAIIAATVAAGAFAAKLAGEAIGAASDLIETQNKVGVIFGASSRAILDFADGAVSSLGQTQTQALNAAATFAQFGKAAGLAGTDLVGFSTELVTLSADLASFNNSTPEQAITAIGSALRGESEPLRNFGVLLDDATLRARAMEMGIYQGAGALTQQQKVLAAHKEILAQTTDAQGDFARTADGLANTQRILTAAIEDAKAEIGEGLLNAIESASSSIGGGKGLAALMGILAETAGDVTRGIGEVTASITDFLPKINLANEEVETLDDGTRELHQRVALLATENMSLGSVLGMTIDWLRGVGAESKETAYLIDTATDSTIRLALANRYSAGEAKKAKEGLIESAYDSGIAAKQEAEYVARMTQILGHVPLAYQVATDETETNTTATGSNTRAVDALTKAEERLQAQFEKRSEKLGATATALEKEIGLLKDAQRAVNDYAIGLQNNLLSSLDLGGAYTQSKKEGGDVGAGVVAGFTKMVNEAEWFGNVLNALKAKGVPDEMVQYLGSQGAEIGGNLGEMMLGDAGLLKTLTDKWVNVQATTKTLAQSLVPEFLLAGENSAIETVNGLATQLTKETNRLNRLGKNMAKPVGAKFKAQLLEDIADAVKEVEAISTAARAEKVAAASRQQVALTNAAVAQALQNLVRSADARNGAPVAPVLS